MSTRGRRGERGFTLVDVLVGTTIAIVAGAGAVSFVSTQSRAMRVQASQADINDSSRGAVELLAREIREAGYWPRPPCPAAGFGIVSGNAQAVRFQADLNESGAIDAAAAASEDVTYQYAAATQTVQRVVGGVASDVATTVPSDGFQLRYYNNLGVELVPGAGGLTAAQAAAVYRVSVRLEPKKLADSRTTNQVRGSLWTNVAIRAHEYPCQ